MPFVIKDVDLFKDSFKIYKEQMLIIKEWGNKHNEHLKTLGFDEREFGQLVFLVNGINKNNTKEELEKQAESFCKEFEKDSTRIINKVMEFEHDYTHKTNVDTSKEKDIFDSILFCSANQNFSTLLTNNPEYREARFAGQVEDEKQFDATQSLSTAYNNEIKPELEKIGIDVSGLRVYDGEIPKTPEALMNESLDQLSKDNMSWQQMMRFSIGKCYSGEKESIEFPVTENFAHIGMLKEHADNHGPVDPIYGDDDAYQTILSSVTGVLFPGNSFVKRIAETYDEGAYYENIFIDGKSLASLVDPALKNSNNPGRFKREMTNILGEAIEKGKPVDICQSYMVDGVKHARVYPIKFNYTKEAKDHYYEMECKRHSWVHRKLFNWGPWKIKPAVDYNTVNEKNSLGFAKREEQIYSYWHDTISPKINADKYDQTIENDIKLAAAKKPNRFKDFVPEECGGVARDVNKVVVQDFGNGIEKTNLIVNDLSKNDFEKNNDFENTPEKEVSNALEM